MKNDIWNKIKECLKDEIGASNYKNWLYAVQFKTLEGGIVFLEAPSNFHVEWVSQYYGESILRLLKERDPSIIRLHFSVSKSAKSSAGTDQSGANARDEFEIGISNRKKEYLHPNLTFDSFVVGESNKIAYHAACSIVQGGLKNYNPLYFHGGVGLGKTHLMHAAAWALRSKYQNSTVMYLSAEQFMYEFVYALKFKRIFEFKESFRSVDVLMIDDLQFIAGKESTQNEFFHTFNALFDQGKQIVLSGNRSPAKIDGMSDRIISRLQSGLVVDLHPADYQLRLKILKYKYDQFIKTGGGVKVEEGVLEFIARHFSRNVRELEGALNRVTATGFLMRRPVAEADAKQMLSDFIKESDRRVALDEIMRQVAAHFDVSVSELIGSNRARIYTRPRHIAMFLAKELTHHSLPEIGRFFGGKDHTSVIYAINRTKKLIGDDSGTENDIDIIRRNLSD